MSSLLGEKLQTCLQEKNCYEAHQIYRTMYFRLVRAGKFVEAYDKMFEGAMHMYEMGEPLSGVDLGNLLLDLLNKDPAGMTVQQAKQEALLKDVGTLFDRIPGQSQDREHFVSQALNAQCLTEVRDSLRCKFANGYWKERNYALARKHFLHSNESGDKVATFLIEMQSSGGNPDEIDLMIGQFVLQCLVIKQFDLARSTFFNYVEKHPMIGQNKPNFQMPLLSFLYYLIEAKNSGPQKSEAELSKTFMSLCKIYESQLDRDPEFHKYLETIGHNYFGLPKPAKSNNDNPLASLMKSLLGDGSAGPSNMGAGGRGQQVRHMIAPRGGPPSGAAQPRPPPPRQPADDDLD